MWVTPEIDETASTMVYDYERCDVGPYQLAVWRLRTPEQPKRRDVDPMYYGVTCGGQYLSSAKSEHPKRAATLYAADHACGLMKELQQLWCEQALDVGGIDR